MSAINKSVLWTAVAAACLALAAVLVLKDREGAAKPQAVEASPVSGGIDGADPVLASGGIGTTQRREVDCLAPDVLRTVGEASPPASVARAFIADLDLPDRERQGPLIADLAGMPPFAERDDLGRSRLQRLLPWPADGSLTLPQRQRLEAALAAPTLDDFIAMAQEAPADMQRTSANFDWAERGLLRSALVHAMRTRAGEFWSRVREIPRGAFGLHELAAAIAQGVDVQDFVDVLDWSGVDPAGTWRAWGLSDGLSDEPGREYNLAGVAAAYVRPRILSALIARGVEPPDVLPSVLDELALALPTTRPEPEALRDVTLQLAADGEQPFLPSTAERLAGVAPDLLALPLHPDSVAAAASLDVRDNARRLTGVLEGARAASAEAGRIRAECRDAWLAAGTAEPQETSSHGPVLAVKMAQQEALEARAHLLEEEQAALMLRLPDEMTPALAKAIEAFVGALELEDWDGIPGLYDDVLRLTSESMAALLSEVLVTGAVVEGMPGSALRELTRRTGGMPANIIMHLVVWDLDRQAITDLEDFGLDLRFADADGRNAINRVVDLYRERPSRDEDEAQQALDWLDYLTSRSVSPSAGAGLDPLDTVLFAVLDAPTPKRVPSAILLARALIDAGAEVQLSHQEIAARIRAMAPEAYAELVAAIPQLG